MEPADGVADVAVARRTAWRGPLIGIGVAVAAGLLAILAPQPAHADDGRGLVGKLVGGVTSAVSDVIEPVVAPLPDVRELPLVGKLVGTVTASAPVTAITQPVTRLADGLLGDTVGALPVVGGLLGDEPLGSIVAPVGDVVDGTLGQFTGTLSPPPGATPVPHEPPLPAPSPDADTAVQPLGPAPLWLNPASYGFTAGLLLDSRIAEQVVAVAAGAEGPLPGPVSAPGDIAPTSAVTAGGPPIGLAAAVLGAGLLFFLVRGRLRLAGFRAPPSPVFATDTSPD